MYGLRMKHAKQSNRRNYPASSTPKPRKRSWFPFLLVALPVAAFGIVFLAPMPGDKAGEFAQAGMAEPGKTTLLSASAADREEAFFPICSGRGRVTCVVDGDTIWFRGEKIRLVGFDTPEISNPGCANEGRLGQRAKLRLQELLNAGPFSLSANPEGRATDNYGRNLRVVSRGGQNFGDQLIAEGLAERRGGRRNVWC